MSNLEITIYLAPSVSFIIWLYFAIKTINKTYDKLKMAKEIAETPILYGDDAKRFLGQHNTPKTPEMEEEKAYNIFPAKMK